MQSKENVRSKEAQNPTKAELVEDVARQIQSVLYESILHPADLNWLARQLNSIFSYANERAKANPLHAVSAMVHDNAILVRDTSQKITLTWQKFWLEQEKKIRSVDKLATHLSRWPVYFS